MAYPNVEALIRAWLPTVLPAGVTVSEDPPTRVAAGMQVVVVAEIPGPGDAQLTLDVADLDVDCYTLDRGTARALAEHVRSALRVKLPLTTQGGAFVTGVQTMVKPAPIPYDVAAIRRCTATYRVTVHATP